MDWLEFLSFLLSPLELSDSEPVVVYGTDYLQQVSELINHTEPRYRGMGLRTLFSPRQELNIGNWHSQIQEDLTRPWTFPTSKQNVCRLLPKARASGGMPLICIPAPA